MCRPFFFFCVLFLISPFVFCLFFLFLHCTLLFFGCYFILAFVFLLLYSGGFLLAGFGFLIIGHSALCELKLALFVLSPACLLGVYAFGSSTFLPPVCNMRDSEQQIVQHQSLAQLTPQHLAHFTPLSPFWRKTFFSSNSLLTQTKTT